MKHKYTLLTSFDSLWQVGKLRPQAGVSSSRGGCSRGGDLRDWARRVAVLVSAGSPPGEGTRKELAVRLLHPHLQPPLPGGRCRAVQLQTRQESENKPWLAAEFLFPSKQVPYCTQGWMCVLSQLAARVIGAFRAVSYFLKE